MALLTRRCIVDTLLDLHAKLSTVVRYYDRMLEERLSKAYNQHSLGGYNIPAPRQSSMPYPSLQASAPGGAGPMESFYTGEAPPPDFGRQMAPPMYGQPLPGAQYGSAYDKRPSMAGPATAGPYPDVLQRTDSWRSSVAAGQAPPAYSQQPPQAQQSAPQQQQQPGVAGPSAPSAPSDLLASTPTADPSAAFYFGNGKAPAGPVGVPPQQPSQPPQATAAVPSAPSDAGASPYPVLRQPSVYQASVPQGPAGAAPVQAAPPPYQQPPMPASEPPATPYWAAAQSQQAPQPQAPPPQQQQQQHHQQHHLQQQHLPPQMTWPQVPNNFGGFTQESFPSAPQHVPQQPVVEEALIDLS